MSLGKINLEEKTNQIWMDNEGIYLNYFCISCYSRKFYIYLLEQSSKAQNG